MSHDWRYCLAGYDSGVRRGFQRAEFNDSSWHTIDLPFMVMASEEEHSVWFRKRFYLSDISPGYRKKVIFKGAFLKTEVWLNGKYLGSHTGYFSPFGFDASDFLVRGENVLAVFVDSPVERDLLNKVHVGGIFTDRGTLTSHALVGYAPLGMWGGVELSTVGRVEVSVLLVDPIYGEGFSAIEVNALLRNFDVKNYRVTLKHIVSGYNFNSSEILGSNSWDVGRLSSRWVKFKIPINDSRLWCTWDQGRQNLYAINVSAYVGNEFQGSIKTTFGIRSLSGVISKDNSKIFINNKKLFLRGGNYVSDFFLSNSSRANLSRDLKLFKEVGINFIRTYAHIEPYEFYELADEEGLAVRVDFPLTFSYLGPSPSKIARDEFLMQAQRQMVEMALLLYNNPSVVMYSVHNEPPWALKNWGDYYAKKVNLEEDNLLSEILRSIDNSRLVIVASGLEDEHLYLGWSSGKWTDFKEIRSGFPSEFGSQSLPSQNSPIWSLVESDTRKYGFSEALSRYGFSLESWSRILQISAPKSLSDLKVLVNMSQQYQAMLLREAIKRFRIQKNTTAGFSLFILNDFLPSVSYYGIFDYFRVPKIACKAIEGIMKPTTVIIENGGDYFLGSEYEVIYEGGAEAQVLIWIVNDDPRVGGMKNLELSLTDETSGHELKRWKTEILIPSSEDGAHIVLDEKIRLPAFLDRDHILSLHARLLSENNQTLGWDGFNFAVKASSVLELRIDNFSEQKKPLKFLIFRDNRSLSKSFFVEGENTSISLYSLSDNLIAGPVHQESEEIYVPIILDLGFVSRGTLYKVNLSLVGGALVRVRSNIPSIKGSSPLNLKIWFRMLDKDDVKYSSFLLKEVNSENFTIAYALGLKGGEIIVPAGKNFSLGVDAEEVPKEPTIGTKFPPARGANGQIIPGELTTDAAGGRLKISFTLGNETKPLVLNKNQIFETKKLAEILFAMNKKILYEDYTQAGSKLSEVLYKGFYPGLELQRLSDVQEALRKSEKADALLGSYELRTAYLVIQEMLMQIEYLYSVTSTSTPVTITLSALISLGLALLLTDNKDRASIFTAVIFTILLIFMFITYPGLSSASAGELILSGWVAASLLIFFLALSNVNLEIKGENRIPLWSAALSSISIALGNMRRRGYKTSLALTSIVIVILALSSMTSAHITIMANQREISVETQLPVGTLLFTKVDNQFSSRDFMFISSQPEISSFVCRFVTPPSYGQMAIVKTVPILGVIGIEDGDPLISILKDYTMPKESFEKLKEDDLAVLISKNVAEAANLAVGDKLSVKGVELRITGIFDPSFLRNLEDVDGSPIVPLTIIPGSGSPIPASAESVLITTTRAAKILGATAQKIYVSSRSLDSCIELAKRLSIISNYVATVNLGNGRVKQMYLSRSFEMSGTTVGMLVPISILVLGLSLVMLSNVYERRKEVSIFSMIGMNPTHIFLLFVTEALLLGLIGGGLGYLLSFGIFRLFGMTGNVLPVDVKTSLFDMLMIIGISSITLFISAIFPSLKASVIATPSLSRRWKLEATRSDLNIWTISIPAKIPAENAVVFANYLKDRLGTYSAGGVEITISDVRIEKDGELLKIKFNYVRGGDRTFTSKNVLELKPGEMKSYEIRLIMRISTIYMAFIDQFMREIANLIRKLVLEWSSYKVKLLACFNSNIGNLTKMLKAYKPHTLLLVVQPSDQQLLDNFKSRLQQEGVWIPSLEVITITNESLEATTKALIRVASEADLISIESDNHLITSALVFTAIRSNRKFIIASNSELKEYSPREFLSA
jgi:beta-mannosidase